MRIAVISCALAATLAFAGADNSYGACAHITRAEFPPARTCDMMRQVGKVRVARVSGRPCLRGGGVCGASTERVRRLKTQINNLQWLQV